MDFYQVLWFILIAVLYIGYFVLEGFDLGVGMLLPFLGKDDTRKRMMINAIGPHWDGNEVWLLTAGGATFAAFPQWYATLFSGFYLPLFLILLALIVRGVAFEFRGKDDNPLWKKTWDGAIFIGSAIPALLLGVAFANFLRGVPIDGQLQYVGGFWNLLNPFALVGGLVTVSLFLLHGALFLSLKTEDPVKSGAEKLLQPLWIAAVVVTVAEFAFAMLTIGGEATLGILPIILAILAAVVLVGVGLMARQGRTGLAFGLSAGAILLAAAAFFARMFPRVLVSSLDPANSLTIANSSSSTYTLSVMTIVALVLVPVVLAYTIWSYWVFRKRISAKTSSLHY